MTVDTVPKRSPSHLRIHVEETDQDGDEPQRELPVWDRLRNAYQGLTGWQIDVTSETVPIGSRVVAEIPHPRDNTVSKVYRHKSKEAASGDPAMHSDQLAQAIGEVMRELQLSRQTLAERECEIATLQPFRVKLDDVAEFQHRMQSVLRGAVEGLKGRAAAFYMLDDETTQLKLRIHWGLSSLRFLEPSRPLRGAVADLEALTGHAVVLEDTSLFEHWNVPEAFKSAVCVPVSSSDALLGTLWFFADEVRDYNDAETQLLEIIAGRLAIEFEHRSLTAELTAQRNGSSPSSLGIVTPPVRQSPPLIDGWQVSGSLVPSERNQGDFHLWHYGTDDRLGLCCGSLLGNEAARATNSSLLQGAARSVMASDLPLPRRLQAVNETLWANSAHIDGASLFLGCLDPATGQLEFATAGCSDAYILRPHGWEPISIDTPRIGEDADWTGYTDVQELHEGDVLLVISDRSLEATEAEANFDTTSIAETLLRHMHLSAEELTDLAVDRIVERCSNPASRSVLVAKRNG